MLLWDHLRFRNSLYNKKVSTMVYSSRIRRAVATVATVLIAGSISVVPALAQSSSSEVLDGGRIGGGSSQLAPSGFSTDPLPETDKEVDLNEYAGFWYQVAAIPQPYTLQCVSNTTAEYTVLDQDTIGVTNSCTTILGNESAIEGAADARSDASLRVNFPGVPFQDPNGPDNYRITYLEDDYSLAIVGDPDRLSGFVLSRTPDLSAEQWQKVDTVLEDRGFWPCAFITTPQDGGNNGAQPVCLKANDLPALSTPALSSAD